MKLQLPEELREWLCEKAKKNEITVSQAIRDILFDEYEREKQKTSH